MAYPYASAATQNFAPTLDDLLTDDDLRGLARQDHYRDHGELSPEHQHLLAMVLPELCGALLAQRTAHRAAPIPARPATPGPLLHHQLRQRARARNLATSLKGALNAAHRAAMINTMVAVNDGTLTEPRRHDTSDAQTFDLKMLGITARGDTLERCLDEWITAATRCAPAPTDTAPLAPAQELRT